MRSPALLALAFLILSSGCAMQGSQAAQNFNSSFFWSSSLLSPAHQEESPSPPASYDIDIHSNRTWLYHSENRTIALGFSSQLLGYISSLPRNYTCYGKCPSDWETRYYLQFIGEPGEQQLIGSIISQAEGNTSDDELMYLMSFVQSIPYDSGEYRIGKMVQKYPYETLYQDSGVCSDKALLAAAIASKMGYGVALFSYDAESHLALGIKCPMELSNYGSGYCFLETTMNCSRLTDNARNYVGIGKLESVPRIIPVSEGKPLEYSTVEADISEIRAFQDASERVSELSTLMDSAPSNSSYNSYVKEYNQYVKIYNSYITCG